MTERRSVLLGGYRLLSRIATPFAPLVLAYRNSRGKEDRARIAERRGQSGIGRPSGPLVWVHGASVGELASVMPLIERIRAQQIGVLVTSGTVTSSQLAEQRLPRGVVHQFVPLDTPRYVQRFIDHWRPDLALFVESDLWPNLIVQTYDSGVPLIMVNGRLSESSYRRWQRFPGTIASLLRRFDLCLARTPSDAERYGHLGAPRVISTGDLKLDVPPPPADDHSLQDLQTAIGTRTVIAAASTHPGEENIVIETHRRLRSAFPGLLTIIAPRHPERGEAIAEMVADAGMRPVLRSLGRVPDINTDIYIADTVGELGLTYRLASIVFMGGSLVRHGGQNPIEAAKLDAAILHGPHVWNFTDIYGALGVAHGAEQVADARELTIHFATWLNDAPARGRAAAAAHNTVEALGGALSRTLQAIDPYLLQLRIQRASNA